MQGKESSKGKNPYSAPRGKKCLRCGESGHNSTFCPLRPKLSYQPVRMSLEPNSEGQSSSPSSEASSKNSAKTTAVEIAARDEIARKAAAEAATRQAATETAARQEAMRVTAAEAALARQATETSTARQSNTSQTPLNNMVASNAITYANPDGAVRTSLDANFFQPAGVTAEYMHRVMNEVMNHQTNELVTHIEINNTTLAEQLTHAVGEATNRTIGGLQVTLDQLNQTMMAMVNDQNTLQTLIQQNQQGQVLQAPQGPRPQVQAYVQPPLNQPVFGGH